MPIIMIAGLCLLIILIYPGILWKLLRHRDDSPTMAYICIVRAVAGIALIVLGILHFGGKV